MDLSQMPAAATIIVRMEVDKVSEEQMAELLGTTRRALERKRQRGVIPPNVYAMIDGRIVYSIRRHDAWIESLWPSPLELNSLAAASASASCGTAAGDAKPSRIRKPRRVSKQPPVTVLQ